MAYVISENKWILLGFGILNVIFLFTPLVEGNLFNYYVVSLPEPWSTFLLGTLIYFLLLVPFNAIFNNFYQTDYYDKIIKIMNVIIPILGVISLLFYRRFLNLSDGESYTFFYYVLFGLIIIEHGWHIFITFKTL